MPSIYIPIRSRDRRLCARAYPFGEDVPRGVRPEDADIEVYGLAPNSGPEHGTLDFHADGTCDYTPDPGFYGADTFQCMGYQPSTWREAGPATPG
jgi:hypothetical protein